MSALRGRRVLVMGLGIHGGGLGVTRFLVEQGAQVTVTDLRPAELLHGSLAALDGLPVTLVLGEHRAADFQQAEIVVRNPGVPHSSPYLEIARAAGAQIEMEMSLFFRLCPGPILGVTGTKGKTTTTTLLGLMLREQFPDTVVAGNLRVSALAALPQITPQTPVALELSSFALEGLGAAGLSPRYALVTNLSADHLDRYGSLEEYAAAKQQIYRHQGPDGVLALNAADPLTAQWAAEAPGRVVWFGDERHQSAAVDPSATVLASEAGIFIGGELLVAPEDIQVPGAHNRLNIAGAAALALAFGVEAAAIRRAVQRFGGVEHRLELVRELDGVRYINDTAATAPEAAIAALHSFDAPIIWVGGGADKNLPLTALAQAVAARASAALLLKGTATARLLAELAAQGAADVHGPFEDFAAAIGAARAIARPGAVVLLAPGCASFGMFRNEFHRGEEFRRIVGAL